MKALDRYDVSGLTEAQVQPGSRGRVLRNLLGVTGKRAMGRIEAQAQVRALEALLGEYGADHAFTAADIRHLHRTWLGEIYEWAGEFRRVNLTKGDLPFAAAAQVPRLMEIFERDVLRRNTPCGGTNAEQLAAALAVVHVELVLIHPFRDGNGRATRMLAVLMAAQADLPLLDFSGVTGRARAGYFAAVRSGLDRDYTAMTRVFAGVLRRTSRMAGGHGGPASRAASTPEDLVPGGERPRSRSRRPRSDTRGGAGRPGR